MQYSCTRALNPAMDSRLAEGEKVKTSMELSLDRPVFFYDSNVIHRRIRHRHTNKTANGIGPEFTCPIVKRDLSPSSVENISLFYRLDVSHISIFERVIIIQRKLKQRI